MQIDLHHADPELSKTENIRRAIKFHRRKARRTSGRRSTEDTQRANYLLSRYSHLFR